MRRARASAPRGNSPCGREVSLPTCSARAPVELDEVEPLEVLVALALDRLEEALLDRLRELAGRLAERVVVDLAHGDDLGRRAGQEDLVGLVELAARDVALDDLEAEVARRSGSPSGA